ncbi:hypothetical protein [Candidatus Magnetobacterium casense]|uniref:Terminase n=1 Tax=Candidatus Magnetobacterium casense TaxID=1455061 RepID=A0ABS6RZR0_9BACT|nr:hypothetical protein [Candidatus Magnetobacterium casensis]MBV6342026.1 hypothetical protein [Candidatus Magnetobacterium casensis]
MIDNAKRIMGDKALAQRLLNSFELFSLLTLFVQTQDNRLIPFRLNPIQRLLECIVGEIKSQGRPVRLVILKARREGVSTWVAGRFYWLTSLNGNTHSYIITHHPNATNAIFSMTWRFYDTCVGEFTVDGVSVRVRPTTRYKSKREIYFDELGSSIQVLTAGSRYGTRGGTGHYLHFSEGGFYESSTAKDTFISALQCVPDLPNTEVIIESTANGVGGEFYERFYDCRYRYEIGINDIGNVVYTESINESMPESNIWTSVFIPWFAFPDYVADAARFQQGAPKDDDELQLQHQHNLTDRQLSWRRNAISNRCGGDVRMFHQEYPSNPHEAFITTGTHVFDLPAIESLMSQAKEPIQRYDFIGASFIARKDGKLHVWSEPIPYRKYVASADVSEGLHTGDFSSVDVIDYLTGEQVAHWHGKTAPDELAHLCMELGKMYNHAYLAIENNNHGLVTVLKCTELRYPNLHRDSVSKPGFTTTFQSKSLAINHLISLIRQGASGIVSRHTLEEMLHYQIDIKGRTNAAPGKHDDRIMSYAIAQYIRHTIAGTVFQGQVQSGGYVLPAQKNYRPATSAGY